MNAERTFQIILTELGLDALKLQDNLEETMNAKLEVKQKTESVKYILREIVINEMMITKFTALITKDNNKTTPE